ncbi:MAG: hypothetical protein AAB510_01190 [Patescibacteria group bacterium]
MKNLFLMKENKRFFPANRQGGQAMIISLIFFIFISLAITTGLVTPAVREFKISNDLLKSKQSLFLAESAVEDSYFRLKTGKTLGSSNTVTIDSNSATATITDSAYNEKTISSLGDVSSRHRKSEVVLTAGSGVSFNYGVLAGQGGINLNGSGTINGNVYANGPITGDSSAIITGTAISGNSPALATNQTNGTGVPASNINFANANTTQDIAQSFQVSIESPLNKVQFYIRKVSTPSNATVRVVADSSGSPSTTVVATGTLNASTVTTSYGWVDVSFTTNPLLDVGVTYWLIIDASTNSTKYYTIGASSGGYGSGLGKIGQYSGTWNNTTPSGLDYYFSVYLGGVNGLIAGSSGSQWNQLHVGTISGSAQANTVNYTNATGNIYCQSGTGNNKSCTSQTDPVYQTFPVSDANITEWQTDATSGGIYTGNYTVGYAGASLGPKKIVGNLTVSGGGTLTITGTLWVTGNIILNGGGSIILSSSYGANDGVIVADGTITISGGGHATGSGISGSYIMMLTTSSSTSAASISGGAGAVIIYASQGTIAISGGASLKEATGYRITVDGGSSITYESGLSNNNFSSGPSGSWDISSWKEIK